MTAMTVSSQKSTPTEKYYMRNQLDTPDSAWIRNVNLSGYRWGFRHSGIGHYSCLSCNARKRQKLSNPHNGEEANRDVSTMFFSWDRRSTCTSPRWWIRCKTPGRGRRCTPALDRYFDIDRVGRPPMRSVQGGARARRRSQLPLHPIGGVPSATRGRCAWQTYRTEGVDAHIRPCGGCQREWESDGTACDGGRTVGT